MINVNLPKGYVNENSYNEKVLRWLRKGYKVTSLTAWRMWGISRLSSVIHRLRKRGYDINTEMIEVTCRNGAVTRIAEYSMN